MAALRERRGQQWLEHHKAARKHSDSRLPRWIFPVYVFIHLFVFFLFCIFLVSYLFDFVFLLFESLLFFAKPPVGFEPTTSRLLSGCSAS